MAQSLFNDTHGRVSDAEGRLNGTDSLCEV